MYTVGSLFTGIGGIDYALLQCTPPFSIAFQVENHPYAKRVLDRHFPDVPKFNDITQVCGRDLPHADILTAGFPCQPLSLAGHQKGVNDERWLWDDIWRITLQMGTVRGLLLENVPAILRHGAAMSRILSDLARHGWSCQWDCLTCAQVGGLHDRKRWFCWCYPEISDTNSERLEGRQLRSVGESPRQRAVGTSRVGSPHHPTRLFQGSIEGKWPTEADAGVLRISHGTPHRMERIAAVGNSVCVPLITWIGNRIHLFLEGEKQWAQNHSATSKKKSTTFGMNSAASIRS